MRKDVLAVGVISVALAACNGIGEQQPPSGYERSVTIAERVEVIPLNPQTLEITCFTSSDPTTETLETGKTETTIFDAFCPFDSGNQNQEAIRRRVGIYGRAEYFPEAKLVSSRPPSIVDLNPSS